MCRTIYHIRHIYGNGAKYRLTLYATRLKTTQSSCNTHTHPFNGPFTGTTQVSRYQKGKTNLDFTEARDSEWLWHQLGHMHVCTSLQTDNHASTSPLSFLQAGCPSCRPTNSVKALKAKDRDHTTSFFCTAIILPYSTQYRDNW